MLVAKDLAVRRQGVREDMSIRAFLGHTKRSRSTFVPVVDKDGRVIGVVTEKDLLKLVRMDVGGSQAFYDKATQKKLLDSAVAAIMTRNPVTIKYNATAGEVLKTMASHGFRRLIVVDDEKKLLGSVRIIDVVRKAVE